MLVYENGHVSFENILNLPVFLFGYTSITACLKEKNLKSWT